MSIFPITPLVLRVKALILQTFVVSDQVAEDYAAEMVSLAEGWGSKETAPNLDWADLIRKRLGEADKCPWRSEDDRFKFEATRKQHFQAIDAFIQNRHGS